MEHQHELSSLDARFTILGAYGMDSGAFRNSLRR